MGNVNNSMGENENCKRLWAMSSAGRTLGVAWCDISGGNRK